MLRRYVVLFCILSWLFPGHVKSEDKPVWELGIGFSAMSVPDYVGSCEQGSHFLPFPYLIYRGDLLKAEGKEIRGILFDSERVEVDVSTTASFPVDSSENYARRGMDDLDVTFGAGPTIKIVLMRKKILQGMMGLNLKSTLYVMGSSDFSYFDWQGWRFYPHLNITHDFTMGFLNGWRGGASIGPIFSDSRYHDYYYRVKPVDALFDRPEYSPDTGYSGTHFSFGFSRRFNGFWLGGFTRIDMLNKARFEDSPLFKDDFSVMAGIGIAWIFLKSEKMVVRSR